MILFPAIDLKEGSCVRLTQGRPESATVYHSDPVLVAYRWERQGAAWLHLVDLDGAFAGEPRQLAVVREIVKCVKIPVQLGGGLRTLKQIAAALDTGVERVILGTAAVAHPELVSESCVRFGAERIVVGIDARNGQVAVKGWQELSGRHFLEVAAEIRDGGCQRVVFTDTSRDGMLTGPNFEATGELAARSGLQVIASGGVTSLDDIAQLRKLEPGVEGAILGKALYEGKLQLEQALLVASGVELNVDEWDL